MTNSFNPRAREGRDGRFIDVSPSQPSFNPRAREGRDSERAVKRIHVTQFQSTRP